MQCLYHAQTTSLSIVSILASILSWVNHSLMKNTMSFRLRYCGFISICWRAPFFCSEKNVYQSMILVNWKSHQGIFKTFNFTKCTKTNAYKMLIKQNLMFKFFVCWYQWWQTVAGKILDFWNTGSKSERCFNNQLSMFPYI